jgi:glycosyltransferase involved in cell wall biosynthesis
MDTLRVAVVTGNFDTVVDGVSLTLHRQVEYLRTHGVPVRVYAAAGPRVMGHDFPLVSSPSVPVVGTPYRLAFRLSAAARRDLERFRPTLVHVATPDLLGRSAVRWANARRVPVVATHFTNFAAYAKHYGVGFLEPFLWRLQRGFYQRCTEVHVPAASVADELTAHGIPGRFVVSPFGVDLADFSPAKRSLAWRRAHGVADGEPVVLFVGRLVWEKNLALWANVVRRLEAAGVRHRSLIVGEGPAEPAMRKRLPRTIFAGRLGQPELGTAVASADVFFFPSASETFGCVTAEALAAGLPAVVADAPGSRDIVDHDVSGWICKANDEAAFFAAVRELLEDAAESRRLAANGPARAAAFAWDAVLPRVLANFRRVQRPDFRSPASTSEVDPARGRRRSSAA